MLVKDLEGAVLDYWVAMAEGYEAKLFKRGEYMEVQVKDLCGCYECGSGFYWAPSSDWESGGPIIEREHGCFRRTISSLREDGYIATMGANLDTRYCSVGPTHLVAAMRAFVASKYGETVPGVEMS